MYSFLFVAHFCADAAVGLSSIAINQNGDDGVRPISGMRF